MIEINGLTKAYGTRVVLTVEWWRGAGGHCVLAGDNGAGKTTLLLILAGLEPPTSGVVRINGHVAGSLEARGLVSFAPDQPALFDDLTLADQMTYVARIHGRREPFAVAGQLADKLEASALLGQFPRAMSKGQRQKAGLLVATSRPFEVLLLDEPTTGLDAQSRVALTEVLRDVARGGATVISSTHDADLLAAADTVITVADGSIAI